MNCSRFISKPCEGIPQIFFILTGSNNYHIVFFSKSHLLCNFFINITGSFRSIKTIMCIHITIMDTWNPMFHNVGTYKPFASNKLANLAHSFPSNLVTTPPPGSYLYLLLTIGPAAAGGGIEGE